LLKWLKLFQQALVTCWAVSSAALAARQHLWYRRYHQEHDVQELNLDRGI
jgi:hypothetical protein